MWTLLHGWLTMRVPWSPNHLQSMKAKTILKSNEGEAELGRATELSHFISELTSFQSTWKRSGTHPFTPFSNLTPPLNTRVGSTCMSSNAMGKAVQKVSAGFLIKEMHGRHGICASMSRGVGVRTYWMKWCRCGVFLLLMMLSRVISWTGLLPLHLSGRIRQREHILTSCIQKHRPGEDVHT